MLTLSNPNPIQSTNQTIRRAFDITWANVKKIASSGCMGGNWPRVTGCIDRRRERTEGIISKLPLGTRRVGEGLCSLWALRVGLRDGTEERDRTRQR